MKAITVDQGDRLEAIYAHRNDLTHELIKYIADPDFEPDMQLFGDALTILSDICRFLDRHRDQHCELRGVRSRER